MRKNISMKMTKFDAETLELITLTDITFLKIDKDLLPGFKHDFFKIYQKAHSKVAFETRREFKISFTQSEAGHLNYVIKRLEFPKSSYELNVVRYLIGNIDPKLV